MPAKKVSKKSAPVKAAKKTTKKVVDYPMESAMVESVSPDLSAPVSMPAMKLDPKILAGGLVLLGVGLLTYKVGPWLIPAVVDKTPITRWSLYEKLDKTYGAQALDDMVNEKVLDLAIAKTNIKVEKSKVDSEISKIEEQFKAMGGLDEALKTRGMTRDDLGKQIKTQLSVEEILKDKINPTDDETKKYFDDNSKTLYKDKKIDDVKVEIVDTLKQSKLRDAFTVWFAEAKKAINVRNFSPLATPAAPAAPAN
jgi:hypothetical protein